MRREKLLERRTDTVAAREREVAARAGAVKAQEDELAERERELAERAEAPPPEPPVPPAPEPEPEPEPPRPPSVARSGWNIHELETLVAANTGDDPARAEEWRAYLFFLRDHAAPDGDLPPQFDYLVEEVFGSLTSS
jgi:hypothetical protein